MRTFAMMPYLFPGRTPNPNEQEVKTQGNVAHGPSDSRGLTGS